MTRIKLTQESVDFAIAEGTEIFNNSRSLQPGDTLQKKINNSMVGVFGQQAFLHGTGGRRVTKEECPHFGYDALCKNLDVRRYCGWSDCRSPGEDARCEIKVRPIENRKWISFNDQMFKHATRSAKTGLLDYVVFYGIQNIDFNSYEADVAFTGIIGPKVLADSRMIYRRPSQYIRGDSFLNKNKIHDDGLGLIFL
jgi:hypothetical protein